MKQIISLKHQIRIIILVSVIFNSVVECNGQNNTRPTVPVPNNFEVNSYTGNLYHSRTDFKIPGKGLNIDVTFSYNVSKRFKNWGMGNGWTFTYNMAYSNDSLGVWIERADGRRDLFKHVGSVYISPVGVFDTLVEYSTGHYYLRTANNLKYFFENSTHKRLTKIIDLNNNQITLTYTDSLINSLTDGSGHTLNFTWNAGRLTEINDNSCTPYRKVTYNYDSAGNPVKVINPLLDYVQYYYDTTSKIIGYADESDSRMSIVYNSNGAVAKVVSCITTHAFTYLQTQFKTYVTETVNGQRVVTTYQYDTLGKVITKKGNCCGYNLSYEYDIKTNVKKKTDGKGNHTKYEYDTRGNITKETDMLGNTKVYSYNLQNKVTSSKDKNGNITTYVYDANGNMTEIHKPLGITEIYTYDAAGNMLSFKNGNNKTTTYEYNAMGYLTKVINPDNAQTVFTYDCHGNKLTEKDANNHTTIYEYNALNQMTKMINALGLSTTYTYNKRGRLKTVTNPLNKTITYDYDGLQRMIKTTSPLGITTQSIYDEQGNIVKQLDGNGYPTTYNYNNRKQVLTETDALGNSITYEYDEAGNKTSMKDKRGAVTQYQYNDLYQLIKVTNALGAITQYNYDANGNQLSVIDANGNITSFEYDALNRLIKVTDPLNKNIQYTYDANGNRLIEKDKRGFNTTYTYDNENRVKTIVDAAGGTREFTYNAVGNILSDKDQLNQVTTYAYDALNRQVSVTNAVGEVTSYIYDSAGRQATTVIPNGNIITNHYDDDDRLTSITDLIGLLTEYTLNNNGVQITEKDGNNNIVTYQYDVLNRKIATKDALGKSAWYTYDPNGNILSNKNRLNYTTYYTYDLVNRKLTETDAIGGITMYSYDVNGNQISVKDANNNITSYSYDALNRKTQETFANGTSKFFTYDENSNIKTRKDNNGNITTYNYDNLNRLTSRVFPDATSDVYSYNAVGKIITANNLSANITFSYDNVNRITTESQNGKIIAYSYNSSTGSRSITYPGLRNIIEEYDDRSRLIFVKEGSSTLASFSYDNGDRITQKTYANGLATSYSYNNNNWMTSISCQPGNVVNLYYTYDDEGNRLTALKNNNPTHSEKYTYDSLIRIKNYKEGILTGSIISTPVSQTMFNYDALGNRTNIIKDGTTINYTANNVNEYSLITSTSNVTPTYDANGNTLTDGTQTYTYDYENRLVSVDAGITAQYKYDALGRRVKKITSSATVYYYYDEQRVIEERNATDITQATYAYGTWIDDILNMKRNGNNYFYHKNSLGTVLVISNALGNQVEHYEYDPYGKVTIYDSSNAIITTTAIGNNYMFTGREYDAECGNYHYRARFYIPDWGRFGQRDSLGYVNGLNLFIYVKNNPQNLLDPYGEYAIALIRIIAIIRSSIKIYNYVQRSFLTWYYSIKEFENDDWLNSLPNCPCSNPLEKDKQPKERCSKDINEKEQPEWEEDAAGYMKDFFHPGSAKCIRSLNDVVSGQQCCYDESNRLITGGPAAGTPDRISSSIKLFFLPIPHFIVDVAPFFVAKALDAVNPFNESNKYLKKYLEVRPPNNSNNCPENE